MSNELTDMNVRKLAEHVSVYFNAGELKFGVSSGMKFSKSLAGTAQGGSGKLRYAKTAGSEWLTIHPDGSMEGRSSKSDKGLNIFIITVQDEEGRIDAKKMMVEVRGR